MKIIQEDFGSSNFQLNTFVLNCQNFFWFQLSSHHLTNAPRPGNFLFRTSCFFLGVSFFRRRDRVDPFSRFPINKIRFSKENNFIWNVSKQFNPPTPVCLFLDIGSVIPLPEFIFSWFSYWLGSFSRRIDLARFRIGTIISYRASDRDFSSVGRALAWLP